MAYKYVATVTHTSQVKVSAFFLLFTAENYKVQCSCILQQHNKNIRENWWTG